MFQKQQRSQVISQGTDHLDYIDYLIHTVEKQCMLK